MNVNAPVTFPNGSTLWVYSITWTVLGYEVTLSHARPTFAQRYEPAGYSRTVRCDNLRDFTRHAVSRYENARALSL